jgi:uncharacterized HhH-GPD family protein
VTGARPVSLHLAQDEAADALLSRDPFALLVGMLLDQQFPMERAFAGPALIAQRLGTDRLAPDVVAAVDPETFTALLVGPPAVHRYPAAMAGRIQELAQVVLEQYDGDASTLWTTAPDGATLVRRLQALPGFGRQKAQIFVALLGKQLGVQPDGWRAAAGDYGEEGSRRSVADVTGPQSLAEVRSTKQALKQAAKQAKGKAKEQS